ncbi:MAG: hypothetical protein ACKODX_20045 [Gemmata sp.]
MKRQLLVCALFALVLIPDWVSACWPQPGPVYYQPPTYYVPVQYGPVYCRPVYVPPCAPVAPPVLPPPRVEPVKPRPSSSPGDPKPTTRPDRTPDPKPSTAAPVRPIGGSDAPKPEPAPAPMIPEFKAVEAPKVEAPKADVPKVEAPKIVPDLKPVEPPKADAPPPIELPRVEGGPKLPPLVLPGGSDSPLPPLQLPKDSGAKLPPLELPKDPAVKPPLEAPKVEKEPAPAVPVPAPAPDALIPPSAVPVPKTDTLPPLTLPPDSPVAPDAKPVEAKSSPLGATSRVPKVSVFAAAGEVPTSGLRKVGFYNHTDRDLSLTIEGKAVTLPAKTYLHAQLPATFIWAHGGRPAARQAVPADATGLDVLFRE